MIPKVDVLGSALVVNFALDGAVGSKDQFVLVLGAVDNIATRDGSTGNINVFGGGSNVMVNLARDRESFGSGYKVFANFASDFCCRER
jgi:hypothetical protein